MRLSPTTMLGRSTCAGRPDGARAHQALGLELGALVGVAEALPHVEARPRRMCRGARPPRRRSTRRRSARARRRARRSARPARPSGRCPSTFTRRDSSRPSENDTDAAQWIDRRHALGQLVGAARVQARARPLDVPGPARSGARARAAAQRPRASSLGAHERMHVTIVALQEAGQQLPPHEAGRPGQAALLPSVLAPGSGRG